jgi:glucose/arabinose dehydrogenase
MPFKAHAYESAGQKFNIQVLIQQKDSIWGFDFLPDGRIFFTERTGALRILNTKTNEIITIKNVPDVAVKGQGGLLDVRVHPQFEKTHWLYFTYSVAMSSGNMTTRLSRAELENNELKNVQVLFTAFDANSNTIHFGSRLEFDGHEHLFMSMGERNEREKAQSLSYDNGKILRFNEDGSIPDDNPFVKTVGARPEIWSLGHRNPQGLAINPKTGELWESEFGPLGGDEINLIEAGKNYGWAIITYGREYYGLSIGEGNTKNGMEQPIAYYVPSISPSGIGFYNGSMFPQWKDNLFIATLSGQQLRKLVIENNKIVAQEALLTDLKWRFRHIRQGLDGLLYFSTDDGKLVRVIPE